MLALVFDDRVRLRQDCPDPQPANGEALIRVDVAGVCSTDLEIVKGYMGYRGVLGHEFVGTVLAGEHAGCRVVGEINCPCGRCEFCAEGLGNHCPTRTVLGIVGRDGVFASRTILPTENLHIVPESISNDQAVFVEPLAAALQIGRQIDLGDFDRALVIGDGRLAQLIARVLRLDMQVTMAGKHAEKLRHAAEYGIATATLENFQPEPTWPLVIDASGSPAGFDLAMRATRPRGTLILKSTIAAESGLNLAPLVINEVTVIGSRCGPFDEALAALADGRVEVTDLISARFPLAEGEQAIHAAADGKHVKVLIDVHEQV